MVPSGLTATARATFPPSTGPRYRRVHRAIPEDVEVHRALIAAGRLPMPVLVVGGEASASGPALREMAAEIAEDWRHETLPRCAHWIPEEQPELLLGALDAFL